MKQNILLTIALLIYCFSAYAQTTTFNYLTSGLSTTACNVFNPPVNISGVSHSSYAGGVSFNTSNGLVLATSPQTTPSKGTAFVINYSFTPGYNYTFAITSKGDNAVNLKATVVSNFGSFPTNGMSSCTIDGNVPLYPLGGYGNLNVFPQLTSQTFTTPQFSVPSTYQYLIIWASGGSISLDALTISQIVITKTSAVSFSLSPTTVTKTCGSALSQTFTATGSNIPQGATVSYIWNLGSVSNGWLYNGTTAPQTITTSANTLTLTAAACGIKPNNVSVTGVVNGTNYSGGTATVNMAAFDIAGDASVCTTSQPYSITNLNCSATINWSVSPGNLASLSCTNCSQPTLINNAAGGAGFINATVTSVCTSSPVIISKAIIVGAANNYYISNIYVYPNPPQIDVYTSSTGGQQTVTSWSIAVDGVVSRSDNGYPPAITTVNGGTSCGTHTVTLTTYNSCGSYATNSYFSRYSNCYGYTLTPNPANSTVTIASTATTSNSKLMNTKGIEITIFDQANRPLKHFSFTQSTQYSFTVADLLPGAYIVQIKDGNNIDNLKLIKQ